MDSHLPPDGSPTSASATTLRSAATLLIGAVLVVGAIYLVYRLELVVAAVLLAGAEVGILLPVVRWLKRHQVPRPLGAALSMAIFMMLFVGIVVLIGQQLITTGGAMWAGLAGLSVGGVLRSIGVDETIVGAIEMRAAAVGAQLEGHLVDVAAAVASIVTTLVLASLLSVFLLATSPTTYRRLLGSVTPQRRPAVEAAALQAIRVLGAWLKAATITGLVDATVIGGGLLIMGVPLVLPVAALTLLLAYLPVVGALIAGAVAVGIAFSYGGVWVALGVAVLVLIVHQVEGSVLHPLLVSRAVAFPAWLTLLLTAATSSLLGVAGAFIAVPLAGAAYAAVSAYRRVRATGPADAQRDEETGPTVVTIAGLAAPPLGGLQRSPHRPTRRTRRDAHAVVESISGS